MKILNGAEIAGYMKANQAHQVKSLRSRKVHPKLVIIRDSDDQLSRNMSISNNNMAKILACMLRIGYVVMFLRLLLRPTPTLPCMA